MAESKKKRRAAVKGEPRKKSGEWKRKPKKKRAAKKSRKGSSKGTLVGHVSREKGYIYFVDGAGGVRKAKAKRGGTRGARHLCKPKKK